MRHRSISFVANIIFPRFHPSSPYFTISASQMKSPEKKKARKSTTQVIILFESDHFAKRNVLSV